MPDSKLKLENLRPQQRSGWQSSMSYAAKWKEDDPFHLSGVGQFYASSTARFLKSPETIFHVPWDKEAVTTQFPGINKPRRRFKDIAKIVVHPASFGMVCTMISTLMAFRFTLTVLYGRWNEKPQPFDIANCLRGGRIWNLDDLNDGPHPESRIAVKDPINIPEIEALFRRSAEQNAIRGFRKKLRSSSSSDDHHPTSDSDSGSTSPVDNVKTNIRLRFDLPIDLLYLVIDRPRDPDASNLQKAMGWQAPDWYWRARLLRDIMFEIDGWTPLPDVDWKFLCLSAEQMMETSTWLLNRRRILRILKGTKVLFHTKAGEADNRHQGM
ncbi:hypothetical protein VTN00DRAFT_9472 [Thermoascus crustaceus]|uniref:uncharacterized protein n=1 Tax=Thermoascus crustaceus TaxID=5088 RepID=UPI0037439E75